MVVTGYSTFSKAPALLEPHYQIVLGHVSDISRGSITPLQRCNQCILQPQPTGPGYPGYETKLNLKA